MYDLATIQRMNREAVEAHRKKRSSYNDEGTASSMSVDQKKIDEAIATLREAGFAVSIWTDDDIRHVISDMVEDYGTAVSDDEVDIIIKAVKNSREWKSLEFTDDWQWETISYAVEDELERLGRDHVHQVG